MPVYRCNGCGYVSEVPTIPSDHKQTCGRCGHPSTVYSTVFFVEKLVERYAAALRELKALRAAEDDVAEGQSPSDTESVTTVESASTGNFSTAEQHKPLGDWFAARKIGIEFDHQLVDTAGYFDDAARMLCDQFELFGELIDRVAYAYRKGHSSIYLELGRLSQREAKAITQLSVETAGVPENSLRTGLPEKDEGGRWRQIIAELQINGLARELAQHCELRELKESECVLRISPAHGHLQMKPAPDKLRQALSDHLGRAIALRFELAQTESETPAATVGRERMQRQELAMASIEKDSFVRDVIETCDASLVESSIKPII